MFLAVLGHVETDRFGFRLAVGIGGESPGEFGLTDAGRANEKVGAGRAVRVFEAGGGVLGRGRDRGNGAFLAVDAFLQRLFELDDSFQFALAQRGDGYSGALAERLAHVFSRQAVIPRHADVEGRQLLVDLGQSRSIFVDQLVVLFDKIAGLALLSGLFIFGFERPQFRGVVALIV